jgi:hypothetical protein
MPLELKVVNLIIVKKLAYQMRRPLVIKAIATFDFFTVGVALLEPTPRRVDTSPFCQTKETAY